MKTISVNNQKGGVGKTTTSLALSSGLTKQGYKVLTVDLDMRGDLSKVFNANRTSLGVAGAMEEPNNTSSFIEHLSMGDILASNRSGLNFEKQDLLTPEKEFKLNKALSTVSKNYDYCIIDTPPDIGVITLNAIVACDYLLITSQAELFSTEDIKDLGEYIISSKRYFSARLSILGIVITQFNNRTTLHKGYNEEINNIAAALNTKVFDSKIRVCKALAEAQTCRMSIYDYKAKCNGSIDYTNLLNEILKEINK